jgi:drug/metabolite transporter (DMT)-like permease
MIPGDRLIVRKLAGTLVAYGGVVLLFVRGAADTSVTLGGDVLMLVSGALLGLRTVYLARAVQRLEPVKMLLAQSLVGVAIFAAGTLAFETRPTTWTPRLAGAVAYQGVLIAGFNFTMNLWLLQHYRPSALAALFLTQPIFGVVAAAVFTGDPLTLEVVVASVAVAVGIGLTAR